MSPPTTTADSTKDVEIVKSKSAQRKINKPLIEKRRRARINDCLSQLKTIVLGANDSKSSRSSKLEKADILEMTVDFVKSRLPQINGKSDSAECIYMTKDAEYLAGYSKCLAEISSFLEQTRTSEATLKKDIVEHMTDKIKDQLKSVTISKLNNQSKAESNSSEPINVQISSEDESKSNVSSSDMPIDLSTKLETQCERDDNVNTTIPAIAVNTTKPCNTINQCYPFGVLYGGQVMLFVQMPQSLIPKRAKSVVHQPLSSSFLTHPQNDLNAQNLVSTYPSVTQLQTPITDKCNIESAVGEQDIMQGQIVSPMNVSYQFVNVGPQSGKEDNNNNSKEDHWRPW